MGKKVLYGICRAGNSYNGFAPQYPGMLVTGATLDHVKQRLPAVLDSHIRAMLEDGEALPEGADVDMVDGGILEVDIPEPAHAHR